MATQSTKPRNRFVVDLTPDRIYARLEAHSIKESAARGKHVPMTGIAREILDKHLPSAKALGLDDE